MTAIHCRADTALTDVEKRVFADHLRAEGISDNVFNLFAEWVARSTPAVTFFYLKAMRDGELVGLGLFMRIKPVDLRTSYGALRRRPFLNRLARGFSVLSNKCLYISFRNLVTANLTRPFFYRDPSVAGEVMRAMLAFLKEEKGADMVTIIDTLDHDALYRGEGFIPHASSSEAVLDPSRFGSLAGYLGAHRNLKKNLARKRLTAFAEVHRGLVGDDDRRGMKDCVACSVGVSNVNNPCQAFFEEHIFDTEAFRSDDYLHVIVRAEGAIAGFHTFLVSGECLGGVLGGFNREVARNQFAYERVILASLEYALAHGLRRVNYSLIDNQTKLRLIDTRVPCSLYFYSRNPLNRKFFKLTYRFNDVHHLAELEKMGPIHAGD